MTTNDWIIVAAAIGGGLVVGLILSRLAAAIFGGERRPAAIQQVAGPVASLAFAFGLVGGMVVALGRIKPEAVDQLVNDLVAFIPKALTAAIIIIGANVLSSFATTALGAALGRVPETVRVRVLSATRTFILAMAVLLAVPQLGVDTTVINLGVAAIFFGLAASLTLLVGLGGREVASEVASTRAMRRMVNAGDHIEVGAGTDRVAGEVKVLHPTAVELVDGEGRTVLVPSSRLLNETLNVRRSNANA